MRSQTTDVSGRSRPRPPRGSIALLGAPWLALLLASAGSAAATDRQPASPEPLRFYVESVAVEGVRRASPDVIVSESLLEAGVEYTEAELRQAVYRVNRLPFVLEAGFSLDRGSERGRYRLRITVEEVRGFFFGSDLVYAAYGDALAGATSEDDGLRDDLTAGARVFAGQGLFFAAVNGDDLRVGYERYRLLDRPILLRLAYARQGCCAASLQELGLDPAAAVWTAAEESDRLELTLGVPLAGNHSLRLDASSVETGSATRRTLDGGSAPPIDARDVEQRELELAWVYDSTDDPVLPTRGDALTAAIGLRWLEGDLSEPPTMTPAALASGAVPVSSPLASGATEMSSRLVGLSFFGARHWPLSPKQTVSLSLKLLASRSEVDDLPMASAAGENREEPRQLVFYSGDVDTLEAGLGARYSVGLWGPAMVRQLGELRWETVAELIYVETSPVVSTAAHPLWGVSLSTGIALRNTWGLFRIGFTFLDFDGDL